ncbi:MAG: YARHG domain-containing protein [Bacteroidota bacterium]
MTFRPITVPFLFLLILFYGCGQEEKTAQGLHSNQSAVLPPPPEEQDSLISHSTPDISPTDQASIQGTYSLIQKLSDIYDAVPYVFLSEADTFFVVANGKWEADLLPPYTHCLLGVVNHELQTIIPVQFDKIYNPGGTVAEHIEVERNGKKGLFQLDGTEVLPPEYDGIYPARLPGTLVQVKKEEAFGWVGKNGNLHMEKSQHPILHVSPITSQQISYWKYDVTSPTLIPFLPAILESKEDSAGILIPPSYLLALGTVPPLTKDIDLHKEPTMLMDPVHRVNSSTGSILSFRKIKRDIWALFSLYEETGVHARDYHVETNRLTTLTEDLSVIDTLAFLDNGDNYTLCQEAGFQLVNDTTLEVKESGYSNKTHLPYAQMEWYRYYSISSTGDIQPLTSNRIFDFTKFIRINPEYFQGCFAQGHPSPDDDGNMLLSKHLSIEDLDIMRNEIFADYGYTFQSDKWQRYFGEFDWYQPQHASVDHLLTDIDKYNIKIILQTKEAMKGKEAEFLQARKVMYMAPG